MAAVSRNYFDVLQWLYKVSDSCVTFQQVIAAKRMIRIFIKKFPYEKWGDAIYIDHEVLLDHNNRKFTEIGNNLKQNK